MPHSLYNTILLLGIPGAGKGTQGNVLGTLPGFYHCACGDVFRRLDANSELGRIFMEHSSRGELVPDDLTIKMWSAHIARTVTVGAFKPESDILILDGIPRNVHQAQILESHIRVLKIVHLTCRDDKTMIQRLRRRALKENRLDDAKEVVIRHRWEVYHRETAPVLNYYSPDKLAEVDAMALPGEVLMDILEVVIPVQKAHLAVSSQS